AMGAVTKRAASSSSPITSTPDCSTAASTASGGTPGETTTRSARDSNSASCSPSCNVAPASTRRAAASGSCSSARVSMPTTWAPRAKHRRAAATPLLPSPTTTTLLPRSCISCVMSSPKLERAQADQREQHADDPKTNDDLRLGPTHLLEVVVNRRHQENTPPGRLEPSHLDDHADGFHEEYPAEQRAQ